VNTVNKWINVLASPSYVLITRPKPSWPTWQRVYIVNSRKLKTEKTCYRLHILSSSTPAASSAEVQPQRSWHILVWSIAAVWYSGFLHTHYKFIVSETPDPDCSRPLNLIFRCSNYFSMACILNDVSWQNPLPDTTIMVHNALKILNTNTGF
jgi:hypothetical protein